MKNKLCIESMYGTGGGHFRDLLDLHMSPPQKKLFKFDPMEGATNAATAVNRTPGEARQIVEKARNIGLTMRHDLMHQAGMELHASPLLTDKKLVHAPMKHCKRRRIRKKYEHKYIYIDVPSRKIIKMKDPATGRERFIMHPKLAEDLKARLTSDYHDAAYRALLGVPVHF